MLTKNFERRAATWFDRRTKFILFYAGCINKIDHKWCSPFMIFLTHLIERDSLWF